MRLLRFPQLKTEKNIPFTRQHIRRLQKARKFPWSVPFGENTELFIEDEIDKWLAARVAERDARAAGTPVKAPVADSVDE
jgi:prophage regulatory protein